MKLAIKHLMSRAPRLDRVARRLYRQVHARVHNLRDVFDNYIAPPLEPRLGPLGFVFGGLNSQHHKAMKKGTFEPDEVRLLQRILPQIGVFLDVGANVGYYACLARHLGVRTIAVEPMPNNLRCLMRNLLLNGWSDTEVIVSGLSKSVGIATLFGASSTGASLIDSWTGASTHFSRSIPISTIDIVVGERFLDQRLFVKIDIEGLEYQALLGVEALLGRRVKPLWLIEIAHGEFHPGGMNPHFQETFGLLWSHGYTCLLLDSGNLQTIVPCDFARWNSQGHTDSNSINYVFIPADAHHLLQQDLSAAVAMR